MGNAFRPYPERAYESLVFADIVFIPIYFLAAVILARPHWMGNIVALVGGGGIIYVMLYLFALSGFSGTANLAADSVFLIFTLSALGQAGRGLGSRPSQ